MAAVKAALKALGVSFEKEQSEQYNPEFIAKIEKSRQEIKSGKSIKVTAENLPALLSI